MEEQSHSIKSLFDQLGLESTDQAIEVFIKQHTLPSQQRLDEAGFWNEHQSAFLKESIESDADWAVVADTLSALLRQSQ